MARGMHFVMIISLRKLLKKVERRLHSHVPPSPSVLSLRSGKLVIAILDHGLHSHFAASVRLRGLGSELLAEAVGSLEPHDDDGAEDASEERRGGCQGAR